jgi:ElaB/YqjD/DUF883 family membrane-anchored ribosome-binding protein
VSGLTTADRSSAEQAKEKAQQAAGQARGRVREQIDQRSTEAGQRVGDAAKDVRSIGEQLRQQGKDQPARMVDQVADRAESLGDYLQRADGEVILRDVEDFGRRRPWAVIAGGIAVGFAASRLLKASSTRRASEPPAPAPLPEVRPATPPIGTGGVSPVDVNSGPGFVPPSRDVL